MGVLCVHVHRSAAAAGELFWDFPDPAPSTSAKATPAAIVVKASAHLAAPAPVAAPKSVAAKPAAHSKPAASSAPASDVGSSASAGHGDSSTGPGSGNEFGGGAMSAELAAYVCGLPNCALVFLGVREHVVVSPGPPRSPMEAMCLPPLHPLARPACAVLQVVW
jgi:hypothetical protein